MVTRKQVHSEIDRVGDEYLDEIFSFIRSFTGTKSNGKQPGLLTRLSQIKIDAPEDFSENFEQYSSGEKRVDDNLH